MNAIRIFSILAGALIVAACGGSSSGSFDDGGSPSMSITAEENEVPANPQNFAPNPDSDHTVQINVRFNRADGSSVSDGTEVSLSTSNSSRGVVSPVDQPDNSGGSATASTSGGVARFWFTSGPETGTVTLDASGSNPGGTGTVTATRQIDVIEAEDTQPRLSISGRETMPANTEEVEIFLGSPFINELTVKYRGPDGNAGQVAEGEISVAVSPVSRGAYSTLDDPETDDVDEFQQLMGSGPVNMTAGVATVFIHSFDEPGPLTVSVSAQDAESGEDFSNEFEIQIEDGAANFLPSQIDFGISPDPVYIEGSGGATSKNVALSVFDAGNNPVPDPEGHGTSFNNVLLELDAPSGSDAFLSGTGADGSVQGTEISVRTVNGIANFALNAGSETGPHHITATVDRADNNVDNDLNDPLTAERTIEVGDGRLFNLEMVSPGRTVLINRTSDLVETDLEPEVDEETGILIPPDPDGSYSLPVTVVATDRAGNPVLPGTQINFGKIDAPLTQTQPREFVFSGGSGNPEEGGSLFSAENVEEGFLDDSSGVDEAVEPGDKLVMFGKSVPGNREHEAARTVDSVIDDNSVSVTEPFNANDQSGAIVDDGYEIPWAIGRSRSGVIDSTANIGENGRASVLMTYASSDIGRPLIVWGQGFSVDEPESKSVAEVEPSVFPGIAPLLLTATPSSVQGNTTSEIRLCLTDAIGSPVNGVRIRGTISGGGASGWLDGESMTTETEDVTGTDSAGCVMTELETSNMLPDGEAAVVMFNFEAAEARVDVTPPEAGRLLVEPSRVRDSREDAQRVTITLTLLDAASEPVPGVNLSGECGSGITLDSAPGTTDENGETTATVLLELSECAGDETETEFPRESQCEFTTPSGSPIGIFTGEGVNLSESTVSPQPCP